MNAFLFVIFILCSAFFSASETAIFSLGKIQIRRLQEQFGVTPKLKAVLKRPSLILSTIVFGNMLVNIGFSSLATTMCVKIWRDAGVFLAIISSGLIILILGEVFPKTFAIYAADRVSLVSSPILILFSRIFYPFLLIIQKVVDAISVRFFSRGKGGIFTEDELKTAIGLSKKAGHISEAEEKLISHVLEFKDTQVSEILTARVDIEGVESDESQGGVSRILKEKKHSKLPVYRESLDDIVGILYTKDVFLNPQADWKQFLRKALFVPESKKIDDLLNELLNNHEHIAIVVDEYGGTSGLVTLEDIEEEIFGEIYDEFEVPREFIQQIDDRSYRASGKTPLKIINLELKLALPEEEDTLAGFILSQIERIPKSNESFSFNGIEVVIEKATAKRIISVIIHKQK